MNIKEILDGFKPKQRTFKLVGDGQPPWREIRAKHNPRSPLMIFDEVTGEQRELRYASNQKSPFVEEQKGFATVTHIALLDGIMEVPRENAALQKFLMLHPDNLNNGGGVFYEFNPEEKAEIEAEFFENKAEAFAAVKELSDEHVIAIGYHELGEAALVESVKSLKRDLYVLSEQSPKYLVELIESDSILLKGLAARAIRFGVLSLTDGNRTVKWASNKRKLIAVPVDKSPTEALADYFLTDEGHEVRAKVEEKVKEFE